jgi:hypothetical protein
MCTGQRVSGLVLRTLQHGVGHLQLGVGHLQHGEGHLQPQVAKQRMKLHAMHAEPVRVHSEVSSTHIVV